MRPSKKPEYQAPALRPLTADELLIEYAGRGDPKAFAQVLKFVRDTETMIRERQGHEQPKAHIRRG